MDSYQIHRVRDQLQKYKTYYCKKQFSECKFHTFSQKDTGEIVVLCPQYHNRADTRRNPFLDIKSSQLMYSGKLCPEFDDKINKCCPHQNCVYCMNKMEYDFHPENFKHSGCPYYQAKKFCRLGIKCFRFHEKIEYDQWVSYWQSLKEFDNRLLNTLLINNNTLQQPVYYTIATSNQQEEEEEEKETETENDQGNNNSELIVDNDKCKNVILSLVQSTNIGQINQDKLLLLEQEFIQQLEYFNLYQNELEIYQNKLDNDNQEQILTFINEKQKQ